MRGARRLTEFRARCEPRPIFRRGKERATSPIRGWEKLEKPVRQADAEVEVELKTPAIFHTPPNPGLVDRPLRFHCARHVCTECTIIGMVFYFRFTCSSYVCFARHFYLLYIKNK